MDDLATRIRIARQSAGLNQSELGRRLGVTSQSVNRWESSASKPTRDNVIGIASITNAPVQWLLFGGALPERDENGSFIPEGSRGRLVPMLSMDEAISGNRSADDKPKHFVHFPCGVNSFLVPVKDDSNAPAYPVGTWLLIDPEQTPHPGDMVLASIEGEAAFGEYCTEATSSGKVAIVRPLNTKWAARRSDLENIEIVGCMTEYARRAGRLPV